MKGASGASLAPDVIVGDRYRLCRPLGEGGMGWVWEATHVFTHKRFALKFLKGGKDEDRRRFVREVRAAAAIKHRNVIAVHDFVELPNGMLVMVMDLLHGQTLGQILRREGRIPLCDVAAILLPVTAALGAAHAVGVIHRDLKPDNVFLAETAGEGEGAKEIEVKVLDFGVAKLTALDGLAARTQALTGTGSMVGTPYYMSPEQVVSEKDLDARADIWSLGVVLYECLAGVRPTEADNVGRVLKRIILADFEPITAHCKDLTEEVASLVMRMLIGDRDKRIDTLMDVRAVLERHASRRIAPATHAKPRALDDVDALVDAHADTVASSSEQADARARGETNQAVTMAPDSSSRARAVVLSGAALAALGAVAIVGWIFATPSVGPVAPAAPPLIMPTATTATTAMPAPAESLSAPGSGSAPPPATTDAPTVSEGPSASAVRVANAPIVTVKPRATAPRPAISASAVAAVAAPVAAAPVATVAASAPPQTTAPKLLPGFAASRKE